MAPSTIPITWMVVSCHVAAITCTVARLLYRWYTRRFWWEDIWAMIAAVWAVICVVGFWLYDTSISYLSPRNQISAWFMALSFTAVLWAVRLSIFLSLVRLSNPTGSLRHIALAGIASLLIMFGASMAQKIYYCAAENCFIGSSIGIMQLINILADALLVLGPIPLLRDVHLSRNRRILILSAFWSSILVTAISITHSVLLINDADLLTAILAAMKVALSLFICNILVLVTFVYRVCRRKGKREGVNLDALFPETGPLHLTTIDLGLFTADTGMVSCGESNANAGPGQDPPATLECLSVHGQLELSSTSVCSDAGSADRSRTSDKTINADTPQ